MQPFGEIQTTEVTKRTGIVDGCVCVCVCVCVFVKCNVRRTTFGSQHSSRGLFFQNVEQEEAEVKLTSLLLSLFTISVSCFCFVAGAKAEEERREKDM